MYVWDGKEGLRLEGINLENSLCSTEGTGEWKVNMA